MSHHAEAAELMQFFSYEHLPPKLQTVSRPFCDIATVLMLDLPAGYEKVAAMRKLLEAKDCAVRAVVGAPK